MASNDKSPPRGGVAGCQCCSLHGRENTSDQIAASRNLLFSAARMTGFSSTQNEKPGAPNDDEPFYCEARENETLEAPLSDGVSLEDFHAYMPMHAYIFAPARKMWPAASVNARIPPVQEPGKDEPIPASAWLDKNKPVEQMKWAPGKPILIKNKLIADGGWISRNGVSCFNLYRPPVIKYGAPNCAGVWLDHINRVYPNDAGALI